MANTATVKQGMTFDEIIASGDNPAMYASLTSDLVERIEFDIRDGVVSPFNTYRIGVEEEFDDVQDRNADALNGVLANWTQQIDWLIESDLIAQQYARQQIDNVTLATQLENLKDYSGLAELIATDAFKKIFG